MKTIGFNYVGNKLHCDGIAIEDIVKKVGSPAYIYSQSVIVDRVSRLKKALKSSNCTIHYAMKANSNLHLLSLMSELGCGADIVSGGELFRALKAKVPAKRIVFSGVGKTRSELEQAVKAGVHLVNIESPFELVLLNDVAGRLKKKVKAALRVNPDVDPKTHPYISTGLERNKFGLDRSEIFDISEMAGSLKNVSVVGLSCHIGSQILDLSPLTEAWDYLARLSGELPFKISYFDLGGGLGIAYGGENEPTLEEYGARICEFSKKLALHGVKGPKISLGIEPGRSIVGPSGILVSKVLGIKERGQRSFCVVDAGMNDLIRPALYQAVHPVAVVSRRSADSPTVPVTLVGPVCESADTFEEFARLPALNPGDLLAFGNAGAYGMSMASQYNSRPRPVEVLVHKSAATIIGARESYNDLISRELKKSRVKL